MKYPDNLIVLPLENKVLLPSIVLRLTIRGKEANDLTKSYFRQVASRSPDTNNVIEHIYVACIPMRPAIAKNNNIHKLSAHQIDVPSQAPFVPVSSKEQQENDTNDGLVASEDRLRLMKYGCIGRITRVQRSGINLYGVFVEGIARFKVNHFSRNPSTATNFPGCWMVNVSYPDNDSLLSTGADREIMAFKNLSLDFVNRMRELKLPQTLLDQLVKVVNTSSISALADLLMSIIDTTFEEKFVMLSTWSLGDRLKKATNYMKRQLSVLQISNSFGSDLDSKLSIKQREFYLRQQLDAIQDELKNKKPITGSLKNNSADLDDFAELYDRLAQAKLPNDIVVIAQRELKRLKKLQTSSSEWAVARNYLDWLADIPWDKSSSNMKIDIKKSRMQLDKDHFGLDHVKKRVVEYLSVIKIKGDIKAPILCLVGPPGVGKTSLGKSIAQSMDRQFHRISLGGVRDEADMRGHRRTYVGAMPGLIIQGIRKCGVNDPLFLLDEIDKLSTSNHHGNPAAALLEVLDPEQNHSFSDHYLNVPFDLSKTLFIATANSLDTIPEPLLDRMEVIEIHGYTFAEKLHICRTHLIPKEIKAHGLENHHIDIPDETILFIAENYTRESGVRSLQRRIAAVIRHQCLVLAELREDNRENTFNASIDKRDVEMILGSMKYEKEALEREGYPGVVTGLAYSGSGNGGILFVEATKMPGSGKLHLTGSLGKVIQESAHIAISWVKSHAYELGLTSHQKEKMLEDEDIHIHFPGGSIPKDGPSAGITLVCALVSLYSNKCISTTIAMTGEISLRGQILPVGGIKEKVISAHRAGIQKIIMPYKNKKDLESDVPETIRDEIEFCYAKNIWDVLDAASLGSNRNILSRIIESHL
ncbi:ATP-dependent protease La [Pilobolus umbonatus]|nr:ATP-dependent protease La [Pilobolus umbonatus]